MKKLCYSNIECEPLENKKKIIEQFVNKCQMAKVTKSSGVEKPEECKNPSFHNSVGYAFVYGQFFGLLPFDGVLAKDENQVEFRWKSLKTIYSVLFLFCGTAESAMGVRRLL